MVKKLIFLILLFFGWFFYTPFVSASTEVNVTYANSWIPSFYNATSAQTNRAVKNAPGAGLSLYITGIYISSDGTAAGTIIIKEDTVSAATQIFQTLYIPASAVIWSTVIPLSTPIKITTNKNVGFSSTGLTNHSVGFVGYTAP